MISIAVVGPIGSGKSTICEVFGNYDSNLRVKVVNLDHVRGSLLDIDVDYARQLVSLYGSGEVTLDEVKRVILDHIFPSTFEYTKLIRVIEPSIYQTVQEIIDHSKAQGFDLVVIEGAVLIHMPEVLKLFSTIIKITASFNICYYRVQERNKYTHVQIVNLLQRTTVPSNLSTNYSINTERSPDHIQQHIKFIIQDLFPEYYKSTIAIYAGSFNPLHVGHLDIVETASDIFDKVLLVRCINMAKDQTIKFPIETSKLPYNCQFIEWSDSFAAFIAQYQDQQVIIVRGVRNGNDTQHEQDYIANVRCMYRFQYGRDLPPVIYIPSKPEFQHISSSTIRSILPFDNGFAKSLMVDEKHDGIE